MKDANRGYIGFSMSVRAAEARNENKFPKSDFKKTYGISEKDFQSVKDLLEYEWHHTSKFFNKTDFFGITNDAIYFLIGLNLKKYNHLENCIVLENETKLVSFDFEKNGENKNYFLSVEKSPKKGRPCAEKYDYTWQNPNSPDFENFSLFSELLNRL